MNNNNKRVLTVGVFDFFHLGHLRILKKAKECGDYLIVAVQKNVSKYKPNSKIIYNLKQRIEIINSIKCVDEVVTYTDIDKIIKKIKIDVFVKGPDQNHDGFKKAVKYCQDNNIDVVVLPRTKGISSSLLRYIFRDIV